MKTNYKHRHTHKTSVKRMSALFHSKYLKTVEWSWTWWGFLCKEVYLPNGTWKGGNLPLRYFVTIVCFVIFFKVQKTSCFNPFCLLSPLVTDVDPGRGDGSLWKQSSQALKRLFAWVFPLAKATSMTWVGLSAYTSNFLNLPPYKPCKEKNSSMLLPSLDNGLLHDLVWCKYMAAFTQDWRTQWPIFHALAPRAPLHTARYPPHAPAGEEAASEVAPRRRSAC